MILLTLFSLAFLLADTASAQAPGVCDGFNVELGYAVPISHEKYCSLYYQCLPDRTAQVMACPEDTLFDDVNKVCQHPRQATCLSKQCSGSLAHNSSFSRHVCCDRYVGCTGNKLYIGKCPEGSVFNSQVGQCVTNYACETNMYCPRTSSVPTAEPACTRRAVPNDPCVFQDLDALGNVMGIESCAAGTSFSEALCNCGTHNPSCMKSAILAIDNRVMDPECRPTMVLDFNSLPPISYTLKTPTGHRLMNNYSIGYEGYTQSKTEGIFAAGSRNLHPHLYFWTFVRNMLAGPFGIRVSFRVNKLQEGDSFLVVGNDLSAKRADCTGTLAIWATYQSGQWAIQFKVVAVNSTNGQRTTVRETQAVPATNGYITVSFMMSTASRTMSGFIGGQGSNLIAWGPVDIGGDQIDINNCPLAVADGLEGSLNELKFFEACGDENILTRNLQ